MIVLYLYILFLIKFYSAYCGIEFDVNNTKSDGCNVTERKGRRITVYEIEPTGSEWFNKVTDNDIVIWEADVYESNEVVVTYYQDLPVIVRIKVERSHADFKNYFKKGDRSWESYPVNYCNEYSSRLEAGADLETVRSSTPKF